MLTDQQRHHGAEVQGAFAAFHAYRREDIDHTATQGHELRFESLFDHGHCFAFPCDAGGSVNLDALTARSRDNYLFVRALVGREFAIPTVQAKNC